VSALHRAMEDHLQTLAPEPAPDMVPFLVGVVRFLARFDLDQDRIETGYGFLDRSTPIDLPENVRWNGQRAWPADQAADVFELWDYVSKCRAHEYV
jgi:hypothetical protein